MNLLDNTLHYTIVGTGLTGLSCVEFLQQRGFSNLRLCDTRKNPPAQEQALLCFSDVEMVFGDVDALEFSAKDVLVVSPGMALTETFIQKAQRQGARITSDIELFLAVNTQPVIAITGSNGKSTVTTLVGDILKAAGLKVSVAGNIGVPVLDQVSGEQDFDIFVLELSSFQLERLPVLNATAVTILNITEDHMDRYAGFNDYIAAKQVIFSGARHIAVNRDEALSAPTDALIANAMLMSFGLSGEDEQGLSLSQIDAQSWIVCGERLLINTADMKLKGLHNINNVMAAMTLCYQAGITWDEMLATVKDFAGLSHRCEWAGRIADVVFINDSKATNVGAAVAAINGFSQEPGKLIVIAGGLDKQSDFAPLAQAIESDVYKVVLLGQDADKIAAVIPEHRVVRVEDISAAVDAAFLLAAPEGLVLFSPACASFDMFNSFEHRGDVFKDCVEQLALQGEQLT